MPSISVVICAHNEENWIGQGLQSLAQQMRLPDEVVVVDNASTDKTAQVIQECAAKFPQLNIRCVYETKKGLHHAREAGWRAATGEVIAMTDADITFPADWLTLIDRTFQDTKIDAITGIVRYQDAPPFINWVTWACDQLYQPEGIGKLITQEYVLNGGNSAYRRSVLEAVNGYRDKPADMLEDRYMSHQIQSNDYHIEFVRNLKVWHTFRRFQKEGWRGYMNYIFFYDAENIYADHLSDK
jgi:glycosyltransferase involved in cell wall biosynthesis